MFVENSTCISCASGQGLGPERELVDATRLEMDSRKLGRADRIAKPFEDESLFVKDGSGLR